MLAPPTQCMLSLVQACVHIEQGYNARVSPSSIAFTPVVVGDGVRNFNLTGTKTETVSFGKN